MSRLEPFEDLTADPDGGADGQLFPVLDESIEALSLHVLSDNERRTAVVSPGSEHGSNVGATRFPRELGLSQEPFDGDIVLGEPRMEHFGRVTDAFSIFLQLDLQDGTDRPFAEEVDDFITLEERLPDQSGTEVERLPGPAAKVYLGAVRFTAVGTPWHGAPFAPMQRQDTSHLLERQGDGETSGFSRRLGTDVRRDQDSLDASIGGDTQS